MFFARALFVTCCALSACSDERTDDTLAEIPLAVDAPIAPGITLPGVWSAAKPRDGQLSSLTLNADGSYAAQYYTKECEPDHCSPSGAGTYALSEATNHSRYFLRLMDGVELLERYGFTYKNDSLDLTETFTQRTLTLTKN